MPGSGEYDQYINEADKEALMSDEIFRDIFAAVPGKSVFLSNARRLRDMTKRQTQLRILDALPYFHFTGQKGGNDQTFSALKKTTRMAWENKFIVAGEIAGIIPIPEDAVDDEDYPLWDECKPSIVEGLGTLIDMATLFGTTAVNVPAGWPSGIVTAAPAGHLIPLGSIGDLYADLLEPNGVWSQVEQDGYQVTKVAGHISMKALLRACRDGATGLPIFGFDPKAAIPYTVDGNPFTFSNNGGWDPDLALLIAGDWDQAVYSIRKDVSYKVLDQAVISDENGVVIHNLAQEDMVALRIKIRLGWQLPNPINRMQEDDAERYPFGILVPAGSGS